MDSIVKWCSSRCYDDPKTDPDDCSTNQSKNNCPSGYTGDQTQYVSKTPLGVKCFKKVCRKQCDTGQKILIDDECYQKYKTSDQEIDPSGDQLISKYCNDNYSLLSEIVSTNKTSTCNNKWKQSALKTAWYDKIIHNNPDTLVSLILGDKGKNTIDCPLYFSNEYSMNFDATDLQNTQRNHLADWCVQNIDKIVQDAVLIGRVQSFMTNSSNFGKLDEYVNLICNNSDHSKLGMCSCTDNGLKYWLGTQIPDEIKSNPACNYANCSNNGYKNSSQFNLTKNCPSLNICSMNIDIKDIKDQSMIDKLNQQCNMSQNSQSQSSQSKPSQSQPSQSKPSQSQNRSNTLLLLILFIVVVVCGVLYYRYAFKSTKKLVGQ